ncbi:MAG: hypothetical protein H5T66_04775, partial [Chloroflexi bacterium]|nr:hypothetical protein [Chloroflexota bacterium]
KKETTASAQTGAQEPTLSPVLRLLVGIFRLEGTEDAVMPEQAAQLLPLWKGYRALSQNSTTTPAELEGLIKQLEEAMTPAQRQKIAAMSLTYADVQALAEERGIALEGGRFRVGANPEQMATRAAQGGGQSRQGAGVPMPPGGGPGGEGAIFFGGPMGGQAQGQAGTSLSAEAVATLRARASTRVPTALLDALIAFLQERAESAQ